VQEGSTVFNNIIMSVMAWTANTVGYFVTKLKEERGQDILEYAIMAGAIAILLGGALFIAIDENVVENFTTKVTSCLNFNEDGECGLD
jgi:hypothetical protein